MKKIFIFIFLLSFISQAQAYDCQFDKIKPGVSKKDLEEINLFLPMNIEGINGVPVHVEEICKGDPRDIMGLVLELTFFDDKLIKINYINSMLTSTILFDISNNDYKTNFKRNQQQVEKKKSEFYNTTINDNSYFYVLLKDKDVQQEYLEINSDKDSEKLDKFLLKIEETQ
jgi:hypothetical protein